jgi:hypothetical protein
MNFNNILVILKDSIASTVTAVLTGHPRISGSMPDMGKKFFFALLRVHTGSGTHSALVFNVLPGFFLGDKAAGA